MQENKGLKIFGIVAIVVGVARCAVMMIITSQAKMDNFKLQLLKNKDFMDSIEKQKLSLEQICDGIKGCVYIYAILLVILSVIIGILAIRGAKTGKVGALKVLLILQIIFIVLSILFQLIKPIFALLALVGLIVAIVGLVFAVKAKKQVME